eukprot:2069755-Rhodomonas_salina.1
MASDRVRLRYGPRSRAGRSLSPYTTTGALGNDSCVEASVRGSGVWDLGFGISGLVGSRV